VAKLNPAVHGGQMEVVKSRVEGALTDRVHIACEGPNRKPQETA
jgi:hypothetical protein